jgi:hypothetical protein
MLNAAAAAAGSGGDEDATLRALVAEISSGGNAVFDFEHKLFTLERARFEWSREQSKAYFYLQLGALDVAVPLAALRREFGIASGSRDDKLIDVASGGLRFVKEIRPGDSIPKELLDGSASWSVDDRHRALAKARLSAQVVGWLAGSDEGASTPAQLLQLAEDPAMKERVQAAFAEMAESLGLGSERKQEVVDRIDQCARELAYIEALREKVAELAIVRQKVGALAPLFRGERVVVENLSRVQILLQKGLAEFSGMLMNIDAQTGEVLSLVRNIDSQVRFIRTVRDQLHQGLMAWSEVASRWRELPVERSQAAEEAILRLYRFLAARYAPEKKWK